MKVVVYASLISWYVYKWFYNLFIYWINFFNQVLILAKSFQTEMYYFTLSKVSMYDLNISLYLISNRVLQVKKWTAILLADLTAPKWDFQLCCW